MKRLHTFDVGDNAQLAVLKTVLESHSIPCLARNENMLGAAGGVPFTECYPELWVLRAADFTAANEILERWLGALGDGGESWVCERCGEGNAGQFELCWNCGAASPQRQTDA